MAAPVEGYRFRKPSIVSDEIIDMGIYGRLVLLRPDASRILKFTSDNGPAAIEAWRKTYAP